jgi:hypothetical protein
MVAYHYDSFLTPPLRFQGFAKLVAGDVLLPLFIVYALARHCKQSSAPQIRNRCLGSTSGCSQGIEASTVAT